MYQKHLSESSSLMRSAERPPSRSGSAFTSGKFHPSSLTRGHTITSNCPLTFPLTFIPMLSAQPRSQPHTSYTALTLLESPEHLAYRNAVPTRVLLRLIITQKTPMSGCTYVHPYLPRRGLCVCSCLTGTHIRSVSYIESSPNKNFIHRSQIRY